MSLPKVLIFNSLSWWKINYKIILDIKNYIFRLHKLTIFPVPKVDCDYDL